MPTTGYDRVSCDTATVTGTYDPPHIELTITGRLGQRSFTGWVASGSLMIGTFSGLGTLPVRRLTYGLLRREKLRRETMKGVLTGRWWGLLRPGGPLSFSLTQTGPWVNGSGHVCAGPRRCPRLLVTGKFRAPWAELTLSGVDSGPASFSGKLDGDSALVGRFGNQAVTLKKVRDS